MFCFGCATIHIRYDMMTQTVGWSSTLGDSSIGKEKIGENNNSNNSNNDDDSVEHDEDRDRLQQPHRTKEGAATPTSSRKNDDQYKCLIGQRCFNRFASRFPRLFAFTFGVIVPLLGLVALSCSFGYWIAHIESPIEIQKNDGLITSHIVTTKKIDLLSNLTIAIPKICFALFLQNVTTQTLYSSSSLWMDLLYDDLEESSATTNSTPTTPSDDEAQKLEMLYQIYLKYDSIEENNSLPDPYNKDETMSANFNFLEFYTFLHVCSEKVYYFMYSEIGLDVFPSWPRNIKNHYNDSGVPQEQQLPDLSFAWNRCTPYSFHRGHVVFKESLHPINQTKYYIEAWENDTERLYEYYFTYFVNTRNVSTEVATVLAQQQAFMEASGESACDVNTFSGAWFWFTIMTTIGYGNTGIETIRSRTLIYTFGFFSILVFGAVSLGAGAVTVAIFKDTCIRCKMPFLTTPWIATIIWGSLYYTWMCVIAHSFVEWNAERLADNDILYRQGFWFAYISTTTIGLGDNILNPGVLRAKDIIFWPGLFLIGFVFLSAFICNLSSIVMKPIHDYTNQLSKRLEETNMLFGIPDEDDDFHAQDKQDDRRLNLEELPLSTSESRVTTKMEYHEN